MLSHHALLTSHSLVSSSGRQKSSLSVQQYSLKVSASLLTFRTLPLPHCSSLFSCSPKEADSLYLHSLGLHNSCFLWTPTGCRLAGRLTQACTHACAYPAYSFSPSASTTSWHSQERSPSSNIQRVSAMSQGTPSPSAIHH